MKATRSLLSALCLLAGLPLAAQAALISGTWDFSTTSGGTTYSGSFSFTNLDTSLTYIDSTAAGFSVTTSFDTTGNGGNAFRYDGGHLRIGGLLGTVDSAGGANNDWILFTPDFSSGQFVYHGAAGVAIGLNLTVTPALQVPEPMSLALVAVGLLAGTQARRRHKAQAPSRCA